ncbi:MAG: methyltransferase domain-containing protein [Acetobacteraceae bacterium]|nr:methyltransferase domain-containing protein [Acetobacteraceae bacterium]
MPGWNDGAITDIAATPRFSRETTPIWLATTCALLGFRAPSLTRPFRYADLGCGAGFGALTVAATCPRAEVWGFDFNPANIEFARDLAEQAGLTNIRFMETSFETLAAMPPDSLPEFDFMIAEHVLSVISPENQRHIQTIIGRQLRPGGLAYLGYDTDTGWTEFEPIQTLMRMLFEAGTETSEFAIPDIFAYLDRLNTGGALYFKRNPILEQRLASIRRLPAADLALRWLNQDWHALMFADVADAMEEVKCDFLGRATLHENIPAASVPAGMLPLLEEAASIRIKETMQDVAAGTPYRRDIYRRGLTFVPVAAHHAQLDAITVAAMADGPLMVPTWQGPAPADPAVYDPLTEALREGRLSLAKARTLGALAGAPVEDAANAMAMLIAAGRAHPVMPDLVAREATARVSRFNDAIIDAITRGEDLGYLVSPVLGSAIPASPLEALTIGAIAYGQSVDDLDGLTGGVLMAMRRGGRAVTRDGAPIEDEAEARSVLRAVVTQILEHRVPLFRALGVLPAGLAASSTHQLAMQGNVEAPAHVAVE